MHKSEEPLHFSSSSPVKDLPYYIKFWSQHGYVALLVISVFAFLAGLLCYVHELQVHFRQNYVYKLPLISSLICN
jgi:hypothetical protein